VNDLRGRVAVVTGAASGIGRALAERFAAEGMKVMLADVDEAALSEAASEQAVMRERFYVLPHPEKSIDAVRARQRWLVEGVAPTF
jgi:NAD(P)-dependent dehydrogenase (short-subunit alcohol dehydrogenase family)